jgi:hypothetical protein
MSEFDAKTSGGRANSALTRRSLVAAAGILATVSPLGVGQAFAQRHKGGGGGWNGGKNGSGGSGGAQCFLAGTRVLTPDGEVAIETLRIGDMIVTKDGSAKAIRWVGKMTFERDGQPWTAGVMPIRIQKGALGNDCPHSDLYVSRSHMLYLEGVLIPAGDLVNGSTIAAVDVEAERLEYFHIELDQHDVLFAEGVACETLLARVGLHSAFDNADEYVTLYGALPSVETLPCAPIVAQGGRRGALASRLRSALAPVVDIRNRADIVRDELDERALRARAA